VVATHLTHTCSPSGLSQKIMDKQEARAIVQSEIKLYRMKPYADLKHLL
jgi:hypothetical protein